MVDEEVEQHMRPIYVNFSNDELLTTILKLSHAKFKYIIKGRKMIEIAVYMAAELFNGGYSAISSTVQLLDLKIGW